MRAAASVLSLAAIGLLLEAACSAGSHMMGHGSQPASNDGSMMGGDLAAMPGYRYSPTTCAVPNRKKTSTTVRVVLADMGVTNAQVVFYPGRNRGDTRQLR